MLVTELAYPTYRAPLTSLYNSLWYATCYGVCHPATYAHLPGMRDLSCKATMLFLNSFLSTAYHRAAWSTFGTFKIGSSWSWRIPSILQGIPSFLQIALVLFAPESPRWLVSKGRDQEALKTLAYYHAGGNQYVKNVLIRSIIPDQVLEG
jgi:hypothetical protein